VKEVFLGERKEIQIYLLGQALNNIFFFSSPAITPVARGCAELAGIRLLQGPSATIQGDCSLLREREGEDKPVGEKEKLCMRLIIVHSEDK